MNEQDLIDACKQCLDEIGLGDHYNIDYDIESGNVDELTVTIKIRLNKDGDQLTIFNY
jgi:hypothetical protein